MNKRVCSKKTLYDTAVIITAALLILTTLACPVLAQADSTVIAVYPQPTHTFVLTADGALWAWGDNSYGRLGDGTTINRNVPIQLVLEDVAKLYPQSAGHTFALKNDGTLWAWERNHDGRLGAGSESQAYTAPVKILDDVEEVFPHDRHSLALKSDGTLWAWGNNSSGQLGDGTTSSRFAPVKIDLDLVESVEPDQNNTFAILSDGSLWAWGNNRYGKLGDGTTINRNLPVKILDDAAAVFPRETHTIALKNDGTVWSWGYNWYGQLGDGSNDTQTRPIRIPISNVEQLFVEKYHAFALDGNGTLWGWGSNWYGQIGDRSISNRNKPVEVPISGIAELYPREYHTFALREDGSLWGWGRNWDGRLGDSSNTHVRPSPVKIAENIFSAYIMERHAFALDNQGVPLGWGDNTRGKLGTGGGSDLNDPSQVPLEDINALYPQESHTFALKEDGSLWAWGDNNKGQLGVGTNQQQTIPVQVLLGDDLPSYNITLSANPQNGGSLSGGGSYRHGESVRVSTEANSGYTFVNWTEDGEVVGTETNLSFLASRDRNLVANFRADEEKPEREEEPEEEEKQYKITLSADPEEGGKVVGAGTFEEGREIVIAAEAAEGYEFINWSENDKEISKSTILSFRVTADRSLTAHFKQPEAEEPETVTYEVKLVSEPEEGGTLSGAGIYDEHSRVTVKAESSEGYIFEKWTEIISRTEIVEDEEIIKEIELEVSENATYIFDLDRDRTLVANFLEEVEDIPAELHEVSASNGIITAIFNRDLEDTPGLEEFRSWFNEAAVSNDPDNQEDENENEENSEENQAPENGNDEEPTWSELLLLSVDWDEEQADRVTLSFEPFEAEEETVIYTVKLQYLDGEEVQSEPFTVEAPQYYTVNLDAVPGEGGIVTGEGEYLEGEEVTVFAESDTFYRFTGWYENDQLVSGSTRYSFIIEENRNLTAHFEILPATIAEVTATNGEVEVILDRIPDQTPAAGDFELQARSEIVEPGSEPSIDPGDEEEGFLVDEPEWEPLEINAIHWLENEKRAILNFEPFEAVEDTISYTVRVNYGGFSEAQAEPFVVEGFKQYTISIEIIPEGGGYAEGGGEFDAGSEITVTASAQDGYLFTGWYEDETLLSEESELTFTVNADRNLAAHFAESAGEDEPEEEETDPESDFFDVYLSVDPEESGTVTGSGIYEKDDQAVVKAESKPGYKFFAWVENEEPVSFNSSYEFTVTRERNLVALFEPADPAETVQDLFSITITVVPEEGGTVYGDSMYEEGEEVIVRAVPAEEHSFAGWAENGEIVSESAEYSFAANRDRNLTATFRHIDDQEVPGIDDPDNTGPGFQDEEEESEEANFYSITLLAEPEEGGTVEGEGLYEENDLIGLNAVSAEGYEFTGWYENDQMVSSARSYAFKVVTDRTLTAIFSPLENRQNEMAETFRISLVPVPVEGGKVYGGGDYTEGETITVDAVANLDYFFINWTEEGVEVSTDIIYTFSVERDMKLEANFAPLLFGAKSSETNYTNSRFEAFLNKYFVDFLRPTPVHGETETAPLMTGWSYPGLPPVGDGRQP